MNQLARLTLPVFALASAGVFSSNVMAQQASVIVADRMVAPNGAIVEGNAIAVEDGRIAAIAPANRISAGNANVHRVAHEGAVIVPGLIALLSDLGVDGQSRVRTNVVDPVLNVFDAFDATDENLRAALRSGVTCALITPAPANLVNGVGAVVRTHGNDHLRTDGPLVLALGDSMLSAARNPSSRSGAAFLLRQTLDAARGDDANSRMRAFVNVELDAVAYCDEPQDASALLRLLSHHGITPTIIHSGRTAEIIAEVAATHAPLVIGPLAPDDSLRELHAAGNAADAGIPVAFRAGVGAGAAHALRRSASLAVRYGMNPDAARRALTGNAALVAGVQDRVGSLTPGLDADFVVYSDDPLRPDARVLEVWIRGERVYAAASHDEPWSSKQ